MITLYHNPRCSKSRQTLSIIQEHSHEVDVVEYLKSPLDLDMLRGLAKKLNIDDVRDMMRVKEPEYKELGLHREEITQQQRFEAMVKTPKLMERPIAVLGDKAIIGRPPENVLMLLS